MNRATKQAVILQVFELEPELGRLLLMPRKDEAQTGLSKGCSQDWRRRDSTPCDKGTRSLSPPIVSLCARHVHPTLIGTFPRLHFMTCQLSELVISEVERRSTLGRGLVHRR